MSYYFDKRARANRESRRLGLYCVGGDIAAPNADAIAQWHDEDRGDLPDRFDLRKAGYVVCPTCDGHGQHVAPGVDADGLTSQDLADHEFMADYRNGRYDVTCYGCAGKRVVQGEPACDHPLWPAWQAWLASQCEDSPDDMAEARYFGW